MYAERIAGIVLAAGQSTRFKAGQQKLLFSLLGRSVIGWVVHRCQQAGVDPIVVVVADVDGPVAQRVRQEVPDVSLRWAVQAVPRGTGDAVLQVRSVLEDYRGPVLIMNGDTPAVRPETIQALRAAHQRAGAALTLATAVLADPAAYGRVLRDEHGHIRAVREWTECDPAERAIPEVNLGVYVADWSRLVAYLERLMPHPDKGEYYLTDVVAQMIADGRTVVGYRLQDPSEALGVNTWEELHTVQDVLARQVVRGWIRQGVHFLAPDRVWLSADVVLGADVVVYPDVVLEGSTVIGDRTVLYPGVRIRDSRVGSDAVVWDHSVIEGSLIGDRCQVGPMARLRPGTVLEAEARIGNFVEVKNSRIGTGSKALHLTYLGDATVGRNVNVGAGTITCNYDGVEKHPTVIEDDVFIGSDSQLVAPVRVGRGAYVAAGSTITRDVPPDSLAIARARQENKEGWLARRRRRAQGPLTSSGEGNENL
ncbi:MAG: bifunctional UDP-N-acetylglucosamine diphosphorylase/glucosamine-1-phosphate N-acetyltransferase GlmU [Acidobacteria bacterium]|nr:bifunctional UDP-N-acetylglucosamine diphosphorylase/glucosamine-1-phosphate N-acetyltransferase GlmU [Acidobacteriota bacterium]MDW7985040.1 bifunctional UDP-N-acetylglucosamine diphosphorylase/glucosamine-1-phosphate N-acetyltransferase GlmU [Acidobacteriota bacterium]